MDMGKEYPKSLSDPNGHCHQELGSMKPTSYPPAHSAMHTEHGLDARSTLTPHMSNLWTAASSLGYNVKSEIAEGETIKTEPEWP